MMTQQSLHTAEQWNVKTQPTSWFCNLIKHQLLLSFPFTLFKYVSSASSSSQSHTLPTLMMFKYWQAGLLCKTELYVLKFKTVSSMYTSDRCDNRKCFPQSTKSTFHFHLESEHFELVFCMTTEQNLAVSPDRTTGPKQCVRYRLSREFGANCWGQWCFKVQTEQNRTPRTELTARTETTTKSNLTGFTVQRNPTNRNTSNTFHRIVGWKHCICWCAGVGSIL